MPAESQSLILRFVVQLLKEVRAVTKPEKVFGALIVLAGMAYQYFRGNTSLDIKTTAIAGGFAILWAICCFGIWLAFKAARVLYQQDLQAYNDYKPTLHYVGDAPSRKAPSPWPPYTAASVLSAVLLIALVLSIRHVPVLIRHRFFPWMPLNGVSLESNKVPASIIISFVVRDEHPNGSNGSDISLPNNPLNNVRLTMTAPILRLDADGWHECPLVRWGAIEWSNRDMPPNSPVFGYLTLPRQTALLHTASTASTGIWDAIIVIRVINGRPEFRERVEGQFFNDNSPLSFDDFSSGFPKEERGLQLRWGPPLFKYYNLPSVKVNEVSATCLVMQRQLLR